MSPIQGLIPGSFSCGRLTWTAAQPSNSWCWAKTARGNPSLQGLRFERALLRCDGAELGKSSAFSFPSKGIPVLRPALGTKPSSPMQTWVGNAWCPASAPCAQVPLPDPTPGSSGQCTREHGSSGIRIDNTAGKLTPSMGSAFPGSSRGDVNGHVHLPQSRRTRDSHLWKTF